MAQVETQQTQRHRGHPAGRLYRFVLSDLTLAGVFGASATVALVLGVVVPALAQVSSGASGYAGLGDPTRDLLSACLALCLGLMALRALNNLIPGWRPVPSSTRAVADRGLDAPLAADHLVGEWLRVRGRRLHPVGGESDSLRQEMPTYRVRWLSALFLLGCALLLASQILEDRLGWTGPVRACSVGQAQHLGDGAGETLRLARLVILPANGGDGDQVLADLELLDGPSRGAVARVGLGSSAPLDGYRLYMVGHDPAIRITARDSQTGERLALGVPGEHALAVESERFVFRPVEQERLLALPERDMLLRLTYYFPGASPGNGDAGLQVQVAQGLEGALIADELLTSSETLTVSDVALDIGFEYAVKLQARYSPGRIPLIMGTLLLLLGLIAVAAPSDDDLVLLARDDCLTLLVSDRNADDWADADGWLAGVSDGD